jgi:hypothetical protein
MRASSTRKPWLAVALFAVATVLFVAADAIREYRIKQTTANWKTYRNEKFGLELKYPDEAGWSPRETSGFGTPLSLLLFSDTSTQPLALNVRLEVELGFDTADEAANSFKGDEDFEKDRRFRTGNLSGREVVVVEVAPAFSAREIGASSIYDWDSLESELYFVKGRHSSPLFKFSISALKRNRDENVLRTAELVLFTLRVPNKTCFHDGLGSALPSRH